MIFLIFRSEFHFKPVEACDFIGKVTMTKEDGLTVGEEMATINTLSNLNYLYLGKCRI